MEMDLTEKFIEDKFRDFNRIYFGGKLQTPSFKVTHVRSYLGQYHWKYGYDGSLIENEIRISNMFDRSERDFCNTILHEMIHQYIRQNHLKDTRAHHGRIFYAQAERINKEGGWNISRTDSVAGCGLKHNTNNNKFYMCCLELKNGKYYVFRFNKKCLDYYIDKIESNPSFFLNPFMYVSTNDKKYAHFPVCHTGMRGWYITKDEYENAKITEKLIIGWQTLSAKRVA